MPRQDASEGSIVVAVIFLIGFIILFMKNVVFPMTLVITPILFIGLIIFWIIDREEPFQMGTASLVLGIAFLVSLGLLILSYFIGYGIGGTGLGQAATEVYLGVSGAQAEISNATTTALNQVVDTSCQTLNGTNCDILRQAVKTGESLQQIQDLADTLKTAQDIASVMNKP